MADQGVSDEKLGAIPEIERFREFLRIPTVSANGPKGSYAKAVDYLSNMLKGICELKTVECVKGKPILVATVKGTNPKLPSVVLNCHYDVVPCVKDQWNCDPFEAILKDGTIVARGTQDMKCVVMQYVEAMLRILKAAAEEEKEGGGGKRKMLRTVHLLFMPDEEIAFGLNGAANDLCSGKTVMGLSRILVDLQDNDAFSVAGGVDGMAKFVGTKEFKDLNAGVALDEGLANEGNAYTVFYGERAVWWVKIRAKGPTGHGSRFIKGTAMEKLIRSINCLLKFREEQHTKLHEGCRHSQALKLGDVATVNLTCLEGGVKINGKYSLNVVPTDAMAGFDIRLPPTLPLDDFEEMLKKWTAEEGVSYEFVYKTPAHHVSSIDREKSPFWGAFEDCFKEEVKIDLVKEIFPAGTDGRYIRGAGIPVYGFSPIANTKIMLHEHNEFIGASEYLRGIVVYEKLIPSLANLEPKK
eukprot:jgi/Bigna1/131097/aug1.13_g5805